MLGLRKKIHTANRKSALLYLMELLDGCEFAFDFGALVGAANMALRLELITNREFELFYGEALKRHQTYLEELNTNTKEG